MKEQTIALIATGIGSYILGFGSLACLDSHFKNLDHWRSSVTNRVDFEEGDYDKYLDEKEEAHVLEVLGVKNRAFTDLSVRELQDYHKKADELYGVSTFSPHFSEIYGPIESGMETDPAFTGGAPQTYRPRK